MLTKVTVLLLVAVIVGSGGIAAFPYFQPSTSQLPEQASPTPEHVDTTLVPVETSIVSEETKSLPQSTIPPPQPGPRITSPSDRQPAYDVTPEAAPLPITPTLPSLQEIIELPDLQEPCDTSQKPFEFSSEPYHTGPPPDTYLVKVYVETTSHWTSVEVEGIQSITEPGFVPHLVESYNVDVEGLAIPDLSRPWTDAIDLPPITAEFDAIVQKDGDTAVFRINKGNSGTTLYKLFSVIDNSAEEIAEFIHDGGDNVRTFSLDLSRLSSPVVFPSVEERYKGPLFDAHLHLTGQDSEDSPTGIEHTKLLINPKNADEFFAMLDKNGVIGLIGFLPINHNYFVVDEQWTEPFLQQTMELVKRHCISPFIFPDSLLGIKSRDYFKIGLVDDYVKEYPIKGIGEIHVDGENPLYADIRLNDQRMFELYDYAAENNLVVMIHPRESDLEDLHDALQHNRKTIFLLHGDEGIEKIIPPLLQKHDNLYYSLDAGLLYPYGIPMAGMTKEKFMNNLQSNGMYYKILASALHYWKPLIEAYPDRIMWGTDALWSWHFEPEVYSELTRFARDFIGGLSPEVQERFGYTNAKVTATGFGKIYVNGDLSQSALPDCGEDTLLTISPLNRNDYDTILPLGLLSPPQHTLPTDHIFYLLRGHDRGNPMEAEVVAPGDIRILGIDFTTALEGGEEIYSDYAILFAPCSEQRLKFDHITSLDARIAEQITSLPESCEEYGIGTRMYRYCSVSLFLDVEAGARLGSTGGRPGGSVALDLFAFDLSAPPLAYANPQRYYSPPLGLLLQAVCPLDLFTAEVRDEQVGRLGGFSGELRTVEPVCGEVMQDVPGSVQGNWFIDENTKLQDWGQHLALTHDNVDPTLSAISIGGTIMDLGVWYFKSENYGTVNREFGEVRPDGKIYCYEGAKNFEERFSDRLLIQLISETEMFVEHQIGSCESNLDFVLPVSYER